jgi:hypothetical protein
MIKDICFTNDWIENFRQQAGHERIDSIILEKMIYALHLLERLKAHELHFVFKGGTSLVLMLQEASRFSIDIDIVCKVDKGSLEETLDKVIGTSRFTGWVLDGGRSYKDGVPKAHYKFSFDTKRPGSGTILLDVLIADSIYPAQMQIPLRTKWIATGYETQITVPTIDAIVGDKLTAFAPCTIGIPYVRGSSQQSASMEICKQLFDLNKLFDRINDIELVARSYFAFTGQEIGYLKDEAALNALSADIVLRDTIETCIILARKGTGTEDQKRKFIELSKGIRALNSGFLMYGHFRLDDAITASARIAYLAAKILAGDFTPLMSYKGQDISNLIVVDPAWSFLNKLKKHPEKSTFFYWYQAAQLLKGAAS